MSATEIDDALRRAPKLRGYDVASVVAPKVRYLIDSLGATPAQVKKALRRDARLLVCSLASVERVAAWLRERCGVAREDVGAVLCKQPSLAWQSIDDNLTPTLAFLTEELGMTPRDVARCATRRPAVLCMSVEGTLRAKRAFYSDVFRGDDARRDGALRRHPELLAVSVDGAARPKLAYLADALDIGADRAANIVAKSPGVLSLSVEKNVAPTIRFLAEELELGVAGAAKVVESRPNVLAYSVDNKLRPTVAYLTHEFFPACDAYAAVMLVSYSLKGRIVPRVRTLRKKGLMARGVGAGGGDARPCTATYAMTRTDAAFCALAGIDAETYEREVKDAAEDPDAGRLPWLRDGRKWSLAEGGKAAAAAAAAAAGT
jgi:mTERF domain-containing protein